MAKLQAIPALIDSKRKKWIVQEGDTLPAVCSPSNLVMEACCSPHEQAVRLRYSLIVEHGTLPYTSGA